MAKQWYIVHSYSGFERKVAESLKSRIQAFAVEEEFGDIIVPTEDVIEIKDGKKRTSTRKFFPGYVLVEMDMNNDSWQMIKKTPKVTGFVGGGTEPIPLSQDEVNTLLKQIDTGTTVTLQIEESAEQLKMLKNLDSAIPKVLQ